MTHPDPDELAVAAVDGVDEAGALRAHLDECPTCREEYDALARTVASGREGAQTTAVPDLPSPAVWDAIHAELGLDPRLAADPLADRREPAAPPVELAERRTRAARWVPFAIAAAIVGVLVGVPIGAALTRTPDPSATVIASAELDAFPGWDATGSATVEEDDASGVRTLVVDLDASVPDGEVREVWLIRADASGLLSLGLLDGTTGRFPVPDGVDLDEYRLVDVSAEPLDGDPSHSADSIVRGELS